MWRVLGIACLLATSATAQEFFTLKGHGGPIMDIAVSDTGQIATASFDNSVGLWRHDKPHWLEGNRSAVNTVIFGLAGSVFAGGDDFSVWTWSNPDAAPVELGKHTAKVKSLALNPTGRLLASASWDSRIGLWERQENGEWRGEFLTGHGQGINDVAFSADGTFLYSASVDGTIRVWDIAQKSQTQLLVKHGFGVNKLIVNEIDGWLAYGATDGGTRMVDLETGDRIADFSLDRRPILAMDYDHETKQLAVGDGQGYIMLIDTGELRITRDFRATRTGPIWALAFSDNGLNLHAGGIEDILYSWPIETMDEHGQMSAETRSFLEDPETLSNGERQFKRKCSICHTVTEGSARKAGPSLYQLFGRRAGAVDDYTYSDTLANSEIIWSAETINDLFDLGPDNYINGTKMPMQRIVEKQDRDDLIEYLGEVTGSGED